MTIDEMIKTINGAKVIGMRKLYYLGQEAGDEMFEYDPATCVRYEILVTKNTVKYIVRLEEDHGWCGSGYTTASTGHIEIEPVYKFGPFTHFPKDLNLTICGLEDDTCYEDYSCNVFSVSFYGCDEYYPSGYVTVDEDLFVELPRAMKKRPVWLFHGTSCTGKSTLAMLCEGKAVYETDSSMELPSIIYADIVVIGNKYNFDREEIVKRLFDNPEVFDVEFTKVEK